MGEHETLRNQIKTILSKESPLWPAQIYERVTGATELSCDVRLAEMASIGDIRWADAGGWELRR